MSYKKHQPIEIRKMLKKRYEGHHTICELLREIYIKTQNDEIKLKCRVAMTMAKSMHEKLKEYKLKQLEKNK